MIRSDITFQEKLNELRLDIKHPNSRGLVFVLVEGKSDIKLFRKLFDLENCKVENVPGGNLKLEECVDLLIETYPLIIAIRDADFIRLNQDERYPKHHIFLTDQHDIEMTMLFQEEILNALIFECTNLTQDKHQIFRNKMMDLIKSIGLLKWLNDRENLKLKFKPAFHDLIKFDDNTIDMAQFINRVLSKSPNAVVNDKEELKQKIELLEQRNPDLYQLTNGHDLLKVFAKFFREKQNQRSITDEDLASSIRMLFSTTHFSNTHIFYEISNWESTNGIQIMKRSNA